MSYLFQPYQVKVDQRKLAFFVGFVALGLPFAMLLGTVLDTCFYDSISHYYYAQFWGDIFVGALFFIGTFLIIYRGNNRSENLFATLAGFAAYGVAVLPTSGSGCPENMFSGRALADFKRVEDQISVIVKPDSATNSLFELFSGVSTWHNIAAAILFVFLAYYSFFVFTRVAEDSQKTSAVKRTRNRIYIASGGAIVISMVAIGFSVFFDLPRWWSDFNLTFWFEALALWAFGISWMVKGRFLGYAFLD